MRTAGNVLPTYINNEAPGIWVGDVYPRNPAKPSLAGGVPPTGVRRFRVFRSREAWLNPDQSSACSPTIQPNNSAQCAIGMNPLNGFLYPAPQRRLGLAGERCGPRDRVGTMRPLVRPGDADIFPHALRGRDREAACQWDELMGRTVASQDQPKPVN